MAFYYVRSSAAGTGTGADWTNAYTTLSAALSGKAAGDTIYVAHDHAETSAAAITLTLTAGTTANPLKIICVNAAGSVPPAPADKAETATITTTGASAINWAGAFHVYVYGITFNIGTGATAAGMSAASTSGAFVFEKCKFYILNTATTSGISLHNSPQQWARLFDCQFAFSNASQKINSNGYHMQFIGSNGTDLVTLSPSGSVLPSVLVAASGSGPVDFIGCDLSSLSGKTIHNGTITAWANPRLVNCRLPASVTVGTNGYAANGQYLDVIGCHSTTNVERNERYGNSANLTTETTIVRTGGASDGTTAFSWKIVGKTTNSFTEPFATFDGEIWNTATGAAKTLTVHTVTDGVTLNDDEIWLEVEYLGRSTDPMMSRIDDRKATYMSTAAAQASDTATWTTTGLVSPVKQKLEVTFTPQMAGPVRWRVKFAKQAVNTVYVCPLAELT